MIKEYLIHSYLYYKLNEIIIEDSEYDQLCKDILSKWDKIESPYKHLVSPADLLAGTGYRIIEYPDEIIKEAEKRLSEYQKPKTEYRSITRNETELYNALKDASDWFLEGLRIDYRHFLFDDHKDMAVGVIDKILKERKNGI